MDNFVRSVFFTDESEPSLVSCRSYHSSRH
nr:MAG TPA: hypothetical protein [Caudoviricetes sp.]